jgi:pimeloyl-ACP methyl ester carboxylesterase
MLTTLLRRFVALIALVFTSALLALLYRALRQRRTGQILAIRTQNGIAEGRFVPINGAEQWVHIRGEDCSNPTVLIVSGHGLSMRAFAPLFCSWEERFTLAQWDRRGIGKTMVRHGKTGSENWTLDLLAEDGIHVAEYLCQRLRQEKIILLGLSQGTAIALLMIKRRPDLFHAYVGTGQIVDMLRNETISYRAAIEQARSTNNTKALKALEKIGAPPYPAVKTWLIKQRWGAVLAPEMATWRPLILRMTLFAPHHSPRDVYHALTDVLFMPQPFYDEYMAFDARRLGTSFSLPFFIFQGDADVLTPTALAQDYFATVTAPTKALVLLKGGGHIALLTQPEQFLQALVTHIRPLVISKASKHLVCIE